MNSSMQRSTKQRTAIQQAMTQADRPLAPQEVLELAQKESDLAIRRTGLAHLLAIPDRFWNVTRGLR